MAAWEKAGIERVMGVDGPYISKDNLVISPGNFRHHDLTTPLNLGETYDLAMCLEVAEHIPAEYADTLVEGLTTLSSTIFFSAAIPSQGGNYHVNEQWPEYWVSKFTSRGYILVDAIRRELWNNRNIAFWYAQNAVLFVRPEVLEANDKLRVLQVQTDVRQLSMVHPALYMRTAATLERTVDYRVRKQLKTLGRFMRSMLRSDSN